MENKLTYYLRVLKNASFEKLNHEIEVAHQKSGKGKAAILFDMLSSYFRYGAGYYDYTIFEFWNLTPAQRDTYLTRFRSKKLILQMNDPSCTHFFENKNEFDKRFAAYLGREFIDLENADYSQVEKFYNGRDTYFAKMKDLSCGVGAEKLYKKDYADAKSFYDYVTQKGFATLEDVLENHPKLQQLYPFAVNTVRLITLIDSCGTPHCIYAVLKMGNNNRVVDNLGLHGPIDIKTGEFLYPAHSGDTAKGEHYTVHPYSGIPLIGFKVPMIDEAVALALKAAMEEPKMRYVGWDVAITPKGPVIIEGNNYCAHDFWQLPGQTPDGIGIMPTLKKIIPEFKY